MHPLSMVYGGGGIFGIGYCMGVADGLAAGGVPVRSAPALGTSAGSWAASAVALGVDAESVMAIEAPHVPNRRPGLLAEIARGIFGDHVHPSVTISAVCVRSRRRHILSGARYPLADLVAASSAVPGILPAHRVDGRLYVDGGMSSATSIDSAPAARATIVVAPLAGAPMGIYGRGAGYFLNREIRDRQRRHPERTITLIRPNHRIARHVGLNPMDLFDADRGRAVYPLAFEQGLEWAARIMNSMPHLTTPVSSDPVVDIRGRSEISTPPGRPARTAVRAAPRRGVRQPAKGRVALAA